MATVPVKSQPLHNFSLPFLKWRHKNQTNAKHRYRRPSETTVWDSPPLPGPEERHHSAPSEKDSDGRDRFKNGTESENYKASVESRSATRNRFSFAFCSSQKQQAVVLEREINRVDGERQKEKVLDEVFDADESQAKPWNLRPRKVAPQAAVEIGWVSKNGELPETAPTVPEIHAVQHNENLPKSMRLRGFAEGHGSEKKEKRKFWISLSREEIEEDVYAMTGSKPARRPKKRPKTVQKQLDNLFPGLYFAGISADSYRVHDALR
ncbi:hypothetical protein U1Q18_019315 [Sarracenia purpurea var. burkii]